MGKELDRVFSPFFNGLIIDPIIMSGFGDRALINTQKTGRHVKKRMILLIRIRKSNIHYPATRLKFYYCLRLVGIINHLLNSEQD